jgi:membrane-bound lytic murein transglycosylase D
MEVGNMRWKWSVVVLFCILSVTWAQVRSEPFAGGSFPSLLSAIKVTGPLDFCGERMPEEDPEVRERLEKELLLTLWNRPQALLWLKRSSRFMPLIEQTLRDRGMPDDLKYIVVAESAFLSYAGSRKGAIGFWQFTQETGRKYGLEINEKIDDRRNLLASTRAALSYLRDLREEFGSWTLAAAAYNMGEQGLMAEILEQATTDYYSLYLPVETQRYIFRILAVKLIFSAPERYGFRLSAADYYPPAEYDRIKLTFRRDTPLRVIAQAANSSFKAIKDLNPEIRGHYAPQGTREILVPRGASVNFDARYQVLLKNWLADQKDRMYVVKQGDSLSSIAERFNVPLAALLIWNRLDLRAPIHPGEELVVHRHQPESPGSEGNGNDGDS